MINNFNEYVVDFHWNILFKKNSVHLPERIGRIISLAEAFQAEFQTFGGILNIVVTTVTNELFLECLNIPIRD